MAIDKKNLNLWRKGYQTGLKDWHECPNGVQKYYAKLIEESWPGAKYLARNLPFSPEQMLMCPPYSALNTSPSQQHRVDYGTGSFEGSSAEPLLDKTGKIVGINVILHEPRLKRLMRSIKARGYQLPVPMENFGQSILDAIAINGLATVTSSEGRPVRAYIRPSVGPAVGAWGVCFKEGHYIEASVLSFRWGSYFKDEERIYRKSGLKALITGVKRTFPILGKHASNYGAAAADANIVRNLGYDELIYLAPYGIINNELHYGVSNLDKSIQHGVLADGPGEEVIAVLKDGHTLIYPPMRTNRLGGTVLNYIVEHLAPALGLEVQEKDITIKAIRDGEIAGMAFVGNAVKVTAVGSIDIVVPKDNQPDVSVEPLVKFGIHPVFAKIQQQFADELTGIKKPSHHSLLTPVDLAWGNEFRSFLDDFWGKIFCN